MRPFMINLQKKKIITGFALFPAAERELPRCIYNKTGFRSKAFDSQKLKWHHLPERNLKSFYQLSF